MHRLGIIGGEWPVGVMNSVVTLRVSGLVSDTTPRVANEFHTYEGGYSLPAAIGDITRDGNDWLISMQLAPRRTVRVTA
jgi:hypothetical protein